jgi:Rod binding domain-containing protein
MEIPSHNHLNVSAIPLEQLASNPQLSQKEKLEELSRQFEAVLLRQILHDAQKTVFHSKLNPESTATGIYQDMVTSQLADNISKSGMLGLGHNLNHQLSHQLKAGTEEKSETDATMP